jgi:hypothetical protein
MPPCGTITGQTGRKAVIVNDSFANSNGLMHFNGVFLAAQQAQGKISYHGKTVSCDSEEVSWTATAPTPPVNESPPSTPPPATTPTPAPPPPPDELPPRTKIKSGPSGTTPKEKATFRFFATEADSTFRCKLDGHAWHSCTSPRAYGGLKEGRHVFEVQAMDAAGNADLTPAKRIWRVKGHPPIPWQARRSTRAHSRADATPCSTPPDARRQRPPCSIRPPKSAGTNTATGIRTPVSGLRIRRPSPLDDSGAEATF